MKIELVAGKRKKEMLKKRYGMHKLDETFSYSSGFYNSMMDLTVVNLSSFKVFNTDDGIDKFIFRFNNIMEHETVHKCIADERKVNKRLRSFYKRRFIMSSVNEEGAVCNMTTDFSKEHIDYVLFKTVINKVDDVDKIIGYQEKIIMMYKVMFISVSIVYIIMFFMMNAKNG